MMEYNKLLFHFENKIKIDLIWERNLELLLPTSQDPNSPLFLV